MDRWKSRGGRREEKRREEKRREETRRDEKRREEKSREEKRIGEERRDEERREEERRGEERISAKRKSQRKEDAGARKGRKVAIHGAFPMICGSGGSKSIRSKNVQNTPFSEHFWKVTC